MLTDTINHFRASEKETQFVASLKDTIKRFSRPPASMHPNVKYLTIMACHTDSILRINTIVNNLKYLRFKNNDIIIINSKNTKHGNNLKTICNNMSIQYIEILNDTALDWENGCTFLSTTQFIHINMWFLQMTRFILIILYVIFII